MFFKNKPVAQSLCYRAYSREHLWYRFFINPGFSDVDLKLPEAHQVAAPTKKL